MTGADFRPVHCGRREIGAYVIGPDRTVFVPAVDVTTVVVASAATAVLIAAAAAAGAAARRGPSIGAVRMGPGGWVSLRHSIAPTLRAAPPAGRPWWARVLHARRLVVGG
jgi:hypothetical protein